MVQDKEVLSVKDVSEMLETEAYVLRFYEKELNLDIKRNNKGHRVYTMDDVETFRKIQDMREQGLQLKAIETIVHDSSGETRETYEQLSSITLSALAPVKNNDVNNDINNEINNEIVAIDITSAEDEKVKQFSCLIKNMLKQALIECNQQSVVEMQETIKREVDTAVEEKVSKYQAAQDEKNGEYYRRLDETMREVQKMRKEMCEIKEVPINKKDSFWRRLFKDKNESAQV